MIKQQIQPWNVSDPAVLAALHHVRREDFVPEQYRALAYADWSIPLPEGECMLTPRVEGRLVQALQLTKQDVVLEVGTGSGYVSALLGRLSKQVVSVDLHRDFSDMAALNTVSHGVSNITFETGDAASGWKRCGKNALPYQAILLSGAVTSIPDAYRHLLADGGRLVAIVGQGPMSQVVRLTAIDTPMGKRTFREENLFDVSVPPLRTGVAASAFVF